MVKSSFRRRCLSLLLTLVLCVSLAPAALAAELADIEVTLDNSTLSVSTGETEKLKPTVKAKWDDNSATEVESGAVFAWKSSNDAIVKVSGSSSGVGTVTGVHEGTATVTVTVTYTVNGKTEEEEASCAVTVTAAKAITIVTDSPVRTSKGLTTQLKAVAQNGERISWKSDDPEIATVDNFTSILTALKPGETSVYAYLESDETVKSEPLKIIVSGIEILEDPFKVDENGSADLTKAVRCQGDARQSTLSFTSADSYTIEIAGNQVRGLHVGEATVEVRANGGAYLETFIVEVTPDPTTEIKAPTMTTGEVLNFSSLNFAGQLEGKVEYVTGLLVPTSQGTLYYKYKSEAEPGAGVGQIENYYRSPGPGQRSLSDITFVPKPDYQGGQVTISYTAITTEGRNYSCKITFTLKAGSGSSSQVDGITFNTSYNTAVKFNGLEFDQVCREQTGSRLNYVTFSQPPERQGALYTNYSNSSNYGSPIELRRQYSMKDLDDIWFVPAPGFTGTSPVVIYYTAAGTNGRTYAGQVLVTVDREGGVAIGGLHYETVPGQAVRFDDVDFNDYCRELLDNSQTLSFVRFDALPAASEGVLYYDYRSSSSTGTSVSLDTSYFYGSRTPRLDRLVFVPEENYIGTIRIPFTGYTSDGTRFSGNVEINVRGGTGTGTGDIRYTCSPGRSVSFRNSDFTALSNELTGRTLDYIIFQRLPDSADGYLYYNNSRITSTGSRYGNNSGNRISNLSFRASNSFLGAVDIPFEGRAANGDWFDGVITIESSGSGGGSTNRGNIRYITDSQNAAVFDRDDFDDLSQWETDRDVSSVRFQVPSSSQGTLYSGYRSSTNQGTRITSSTSITAGNLDRVAFVPASSFTGTAYIDFTATAAGSGGTFTGTVEVEVNRAAAAVTVRYTTRTAPVRFYSGDFGRNGYTLSSIRFDSLPSSAAGYLYYQYTSPSRYGRQASTSTSYRASSGELISDLTFVPRAGYTGTVSMAYTGTNSNGSTFDGEVLITVSPSYSSSYFNDMGSYSDAQRAAVDFLRENNITNGISSTQFGPEYSIERGDFAVMVCQAFGLSSSGSYNAFYDVPSGAYYAQAVNTLRALGIVSGVGDGAYAPRGTVSRQDAVCMLQRAMRSSGWNASDGYTSSLSAYGDGSSVAGYAQGPVAGAIQKGWLPTRNGRLEPRAPLTRVEMAEMIHRVLTY